MKYYRNSNSIIERKLKEEPFPRKSVQQNNISPLLRIEEDKVDVVKSPLQERAIRMSTDNSEQINLFEHINPISNKQKYFLY